MSHFYKRAWCTVSQVYHNKNLLLEILICLDSNLPDKIFKKSEEDLELEVKRRLQNNRYLIVLDDVWDIEAWKGLEATLPDNRNESRVILTSRNRNIAAPLGELDAGPHFIRSLRHDESWDLLVGKLFPGKNSHPPELCGLQGQILEMYQGLPLIIIVLTGILANEDKCGWKQIVESLSSNVLFCTEQCIATLDLSYKNLPDHIKPCFLYFGAFPEDYEHNPKRLTWLWVADGLVQKAESNSSEDVANGYMMDLISRSLVMVSKQSSTGGIKACRIHDLVHEFCVRKAKEEKFMQLACGYDELYTLNMQHNLRRLCIHSEPEHFCMSRLFVPTIRSLLFFSHGKRYNGPMFNISFIFGIFKLVRVLDLSQVVLDSTFLGEPSLLVLLRYLAVLVDSNSIASSIASFPNLETFIVV
ncbi:putative late blight resistance protein homolog R1B-17 [Coffea eugenioides]|uniref:putative late blight resistance protein homolog R1B-17 n=1 Tax=Coffea eugenioides TaxID=49369 RepID=UPI000F60AB90|nr:putative late blight resistance protein homolog R1B-17 [Coffea eugenioides]